MTNRLTPNAKTLLAAALAASALMGLSACGNSSSKPSAAAAAVTSAANTTAASSAPSTAQQSPAPANASTSQPAAAATTDANADASQPPTADPAQNQPTHAQTHAPAPKPTKPASPALPGACATSHLKGTVTGLTRPINHVLLTVTNTGSTTCDLYYYPDLRLDADQQSVTQALEDSKPQAVVTIAPGDSAYASIGTSAADGSGGTPKLEKQVEVFLESRDQSGSLPGSMTLPLPAGTYVDVDKAFVTYWQSDLQSATAW